MNMKFWLLTCWIVLKIIKDIFTFHVTTTSCLSYTLGSYTANTIPADALAT